MRAHPPGHGQGVTAVEATKMKYCLCRTGHKGKDVIAPIHLESGSREKLRESAWSSLLSCTHRIIAWGIVRHGTRNGTDPVRIMDGGDRGISAFNKFICAESINKELGVLWKYRSDSSVIEQKDRRGLAFSGN
jgi:hypothetical protein